MPHILVVDDNEDNRVMLSRRLARRDMDVSVAEDGPAALAAVKRGGVDVVLLDVMMPGMSGIDVLKIVRETHNALELPIIMATAKAESEDVVEALSAGANDYVTKPIDFPVLLARLKTVLMASEAFRKSASPPDTSTLDRIGPGTVLHGRYELGERIGQGGFAVVYAGRQLSTGQDVAIKLLHEDLIDDVQLARFEREMKIIASLSHPHIVTLIDSGHVRSTASALARPRGKTATRAGKRGKQPPQTADEPFSLPYIVMELLEGEPLNNQLKRGALPTAEAVDLALPVISAVGTAHDAGIVHRDLKPANIFLAQGPGGTSRPTVLDFGIAKGSQQSTLTVPSAMVGTPQYMAPEQASGASPVDHRADQYALGLLLYESLAGASPFAGMSFYQVVHAVAYAEYAKPAEAVQGLPPELGAVLERALSREPLERFDDVYCLGQALLPFASPEGAAQWARALRSSSVALPLVTRKSNAPEAITQDRPHDKSRPRPTDPKDEDAGSAVRERGLEDFGAIQLTKRREPAERAAERGPERAANGDPEA